jgi:hypothetical protein
MFAASSLRPWITGKQEVISNDSVGNWRLALVFQKGICGDFILCGLSPPVSPSCLLVHAYSFWNGSRRTMEGKEYCARSFFVTTSSAFSNHQNFLVDILASCRYLLRQFGGRRMKCKTSFSSEGASTRRLFSESLVCPKCGGITRPLKAEP